MCLITKDPESPPMVATKPIHVYKILTARPWDDEFPYKTPFQEASVSFNQDGECRMLSAITKVTYDQKVTVGPNQWVICPIRFITRGLHAYTRRTYDNDGKLGLSFTKVFHAVIPIGAKYFIGKSHDIVSDDMIIFERLRNYNDYIASLDKTE